MAHRITSRIEYETYVRALSIIHNCSVTSTGRTRKRNGLVGGAARSRHMEWLGHDLVPDENTVENRRSLMADANKLGMYALDEKDHVHVNVMRDDIPSEFT